MNYNNSVSTKEKNEEGSSYSAMINDPLIDLSLDEINQNIFLLSNYFFPNCSISYYCLNPETKKIEHTLANIDLWPIQENTIRWLSHHIKKRKKSAPYIYVKNRSLFILTDFSRLKLDKEKFNYSCDDCLFINLTKSDGSLYGILFIHRWFDKKKLDFTQLSLSEKMTLFTQKLNRLSINHVHHMYLFLFCKSCMYSVDGHTNF